LNPLTELYVTAPRLGGMLKDSFPEIFGSGKVSKAAVCDKVAPHKANGIQLVSQTPVTPAHPQTTSQESMSARSCPQNIQNPSLELEVTEAVARSYISKIAVSEDEKETSAAILVLLQFFSKKPNASKVIDEFDKLIVSLIPDKKTRVLETLFTLICSSSDKYLSFLLTLRKRKMLFCDFLKFLSTCIISKVVLKGFYWKYVEKKAKLEQLTPRDIITSDVLLCKEVRIEDLFSVSLFILLQYPEATNGSPLLLEILFSVASPGQVSRLCQEIEFGLISSGAPVLIPIQDIAKIHILLEASIEWDSISQMYFWKVLGSCSMLQSKDWFADFGIKTWLKIQKLSQTLGVLLHGFVQSLHRFSATFLVEVVQSPAQYESVIFSILLRCLNSVDSLVSLAFFLSVGFDCCLGT
jgi:hypothetical protein